MGRTVSGKPATKAGRATKAGNAAEVRARILDGFSSWAYRDGIRAVMMGELATRLRMSAVTLYKYFASKDELVAATVEAWAQDLAAIDALDWKKVTNGKSALEMLSRWSDVWTSGIGGVNPLFFEDLRRDHPASWQRLRGLVAERKRESMPYLVSLLDPGVNPVAALRLLDRMVMAASDPRFARENGLSRREAVRTALSIWGGGALRQPATLEISETRADMPPAKKPAPKRAASRPATPVTAKPKKKAARAK